ncbi:MAG TPA: heme o synthase [Candidatus Acidoferrales bacterium]|nr:heme o synthase [Candidatus Acidoferrales bacterium]
MMTPATPATSARAAAAPAMARSYAYLLLTKPDVTFLVVLTTMAGYYLGSTGSFSSIGMFNVVFGTSLVAAGTAALNHWTERASDAKMRRTCARPLPIGALRPAEAFAFGAGLIFAGGLYLALLANWLACALALLTTLLYLGAYTPLKKRTTWATAVGAFPGAIPPLVGWAAARGGLNEGAWLLFGILFLWQFPHFYSIAWMYREDYSRAGIQMLPVVDATGSATFGQIIFTAAVLVPVSLLPSVIGLAGIRYFFGALVIGMLLVEACLWASRNRTNVRAKWLMHATVAHIPLLLGLLMFDKVVK